MALFENFPYTNTHELNLDWIVKIAKDFLEQYTHIQQLIEDGETSLVNLKNEGLEELQAKADALEAALQAWYDTHSEDIAQELASALADLNEWYTQHEGYLDQYVTDSITEFGQAAERKAAETIATIPADYTTLSQEVTNIHNAVRQIPAIGLKILTDPEIDVARNTGFYNKSTGAYNSTTSLSHKLFPCSPKDILIVTTYTGGTANPINFYNGTPGASTYLGQFLPAYYPAKVDDMYELNNQIVVVPDNATYCVVNFSEGTEHTDFVVKHIVKPDISILDTLDNMLRIIDPIAINVSQGFYSSATGAFVTSSQYKHCIVAVQPGEKYLITTTYAGTAHYALFYNGTPSAETYVGISGATSQDQISIIDYPVIIPDNVSYMVVNCARTTTTTDYPLSVKKDTNSYANYTKQRIYYNRDNDRIVLVTKYYDDMDLVTILQKKGNNNLFDFGSFFVSPNTDRYPLPSESGATLIDAATDFMGPFVVRAINNIDGDIPNSHHFTGGNHDYNNVGAGGGTPTARTTEINFWADGYGITNGFGYCSSVRITWTNYVQGYNTKKADGTGREILMEKHEALFDGTTWQITNIITPLEDIVIELYYGMQLSLPLPNYNYAYFIGGPNRERYTIGSEAGSGDVQSCDMLHAIGSNGSNEIYMTIDPTFDLGKRIHNEGPNGMILSGRKGYAVLINTDTRMNTGEKYAFKGSYKFLSVVDHTD